MSIVANVSGVGTPAGPAVPAWTAAAAAPRVTSVLSVTPPMLVKPQTYSPRARIERWAGVRPPSSGAPSAPVDRRTSIAAVLSDARGTSSASQPSRSPLKARPIDEDDHR
eukprot:7378271-Prymnesium_polylepis.1